MLPFCHLVLQATLLRFVARDSKEVLKHLLLSLVHIAPHSSELMLHPFKWRAATRKGPKTLNKQSPRLPLLLNLKEHCRKLHRTDLRGEPENGTSPCRTSSSTMDIQSHRATYVGPEPSRFMGWGPIRTAISCTCFLQEYTGSKQPFGCHLPWVDRCSSAMSMLSCELAHVHVWNQHLAVNSLL